jgi:hypothetical protein
MSELVQILREPLLEFAEKGKTNDPYEGLSLFGAFTKSSSSCRHAVVGTSFALTSWSGFSDRFNSFVACEDPGRLRAWPAFPSFEVAFGQHWQSPVRMYSLDESELNRAAFLSDPHQRTAAVVNCYLNEIKKLEKVDETPRVVICIVPDQVYNNCRMKSSIPVKHRVQNEGLSASELRKIADELASPQGLLFPEEDEDILNAIKDFDFSPDFRRQLKAKVMPLGIPVQIIKESTLEVPPELEAGEPGTNPLSDRLWNLAVGLSYKTGQKPWKLAEAREGVCYVGIAFKKAESGVRDACCAAQMFLDNGDGIVFVGEFGPWYSPENAQFQLSETAAHDLLRGTLKTYEEQGGPALREVFLHCASRVSDEEIQGYERAVPSGVKLVICRIRVEKGGPRLFRPGNYPPIRGTFLRRHSKFGLLYSSGFNPCAGTYEGFEVPVPLGISIQHGDAELEQVARDVLSLTKLNYNSCSFGSAVPITIRYSQQIGEILLANPGLKPDERQHTLRYYM